VLVALQDAPSIASAPTAVSPRLLASTETAVIAGLLLLLYGYRRRQYILWWMWGWVLLSAASLLTYTSDFSPQIAAMLFGAAQFLRITAALLFVVAVDAYRQKPTIKRGHGLLLLPVAIWFTLAPAALGTVAVFTPGHVLIAATMAVAGGAHLILARQMRMLGATMVGVLLLANATLNGWMATRHGVPIGETASIVLLVRLVLYLLTALGMQLMTFEDMTYELQHTNRQLANAQDDLRQLAVTDALTGTRNRRFFNEVIGRELQRHRRYQTPLSIVFIDIDRFKTINDTMGHDTGDRVLREVAGFLLKNIREADYVFRWGGDEFLVLMSCGEDEARRRAVALRRAFAESPHLAGLPKGVALSIGCVEVPPDTGDILPLVQAADERMYADKRRRR
jgi:diguanylate cyclase (GGDEF)-like protein